MTHTTHHSTKPTKLIVTYPGGEYPIYIGTGLIDDQSYLKRHIKSKQVMIVSNETIAPIYLATICEQLNDYACDSVILPDGEQYKTLETMSTIINALAEGGHHRDTTLIALGGGVIGDMAGFAAACYQRGVAIIQIPTSLLGQVDASIGGKTAVNHPKGKNLIGAFHQPVAVLIDIDTLQTLPDREFRTGIAEIIKAALIKDANFFQWLEDNIETLLNRDQNAITHAIIESCRIKRDIVAQDEKEQNVRALLNLGHTFAHAIEQNLGYGVWLHGEAVAMGIILAADLSHKQGLITHKDLTRIQAIFTQVGLPKQLPQHLKYDKLLATMEGDKKIINSQLRLVLLKSIGDAFITNEITPIEIKNLLCQYIR